MQQFDWAKWLETQGPLWVIYALTVTGLVMLARQILKYLPVLFEKHMALLEKTTKSVTDSADAVNRINTSVEASVESLDQQQLNISDAARPFSKAIVAMAHSETKDEVRRHLDEMEEILARLKK